MSSDVQEYFRVQNLDHDTLGKFFVWRFYSRHISSWLNYSGEFIDRRFYSSRNNRTPSISSIYVTLKFRNSLSQLKEGKKIRGPQIVYWVLLFQVGSLFSNHQQQQEQTHRPSRPNSKASNWVWYGLRAVQRVNSSHWPVKMPNHPRTMFVQFEMTSF